MSVSTLTTATPVPAGAGDLARRREAGAQAASQPLLRKSQVSVGGADHEVEVAVAVEVAEGEVGGGQSRRRAPQRGRRVPASWSPGLVVPSSRPLL